MTMLEVSLKDAARTCIGARLQLKLAREGVSHGGLGLLAKHRKRERLRALLEILKTLKTLVRMCGTLQIVSTTSGCVARFVKEMIVNS